MFHLKGRFALLSIRSKIITAFLFGCLVVTFSWVIARIVFKETFNTIEVITKPDPKLAIINSLFQKIQRLDYSQKVQALTLKDKPLASILDESQPVINLLDTLKIYCVNDTFQLNRILRMQKILYERDELFLNYMKYRFGTLKNNPLSKDIRELSEYVSRNIKKGDSNIVKTTKKNTTTTTVMNAEDPVNKTDKKEPFFKRVFSRKKNKEEISRPAVKLVTEDIQETIDTFAVTQRDSFMKDMERAIVSIEKDRSKRSTKLIDHELKLASAGTIFIDELELLLRQVQAEEIRDLQKNTESLSAVFSDAFNWVEIILCAFLCLILILIFLIFSDIARSNKIKLQLIEAKEKAEYLEQVKHRFLANMSHEIRTPLQAILGYSELVKDEAKPAKESLNAIYRSSEHLLQIVNEILDYSRIISGKFVFEKQDFNMQEVVAEVAEIMEGQAENKNLFFKIKTDIPSDAFYSGDSFRLRQILLNLLGNAIKFTGSGEINFQVSSKDVGTKKTEFIFKIQDTGVGMTQEELKRIFHSFEQAGEGTQREFGGTGLGLSIVKSLVEMQGGKIEASSEKNKGSVFTLVMVYLKSTLKPGTIQTEFIREKIICTEKVIVVDDDAFILQLCSTLLSKHSIPHVCYSSSEKAAAAEWDEDVKTVLIDMRMPVIDGKELYRRLKKSAVPDVRFIALTAQALPDEKQAILNEGFDAVLLKPFRERDLLELFTESSPGDAAYSSLEDKLDISSIEKLCMHDPALIKKSFEIFLSETTSDLKNFSVAIETMDSDQITEMSHKLSSRVGQLGFRALAEELRILENQGRANKVMFDKEKLQEIIRKIYRMVEQVKSLSKV